MATYLDKIFVSVDETFLDFYFKHFIYGVHYKFKDWTK